MKKLHIQEAAQVVSAWDDGTPLKALCGYSRVTTEAEYEAIRDVAPTCRNCERIAQGHVDRGNAAELPKRRSAAEIRKRLASPQWHVYQVTATFESGTFPLAG